MKSRVVKIKEQPKRIRDPKNMMLGFVFRGLSSLDKHPRRILLLSDTPTTDMLQFK